MSITGVGGRYSLLVQSLGVSRAQLDDLQRQLGTGQRSTSYAGLGIDRGLAVSLRSQLSLMSGYADAVKNVGVRIDLAQSVLTDVSKLSATVKSAANTSTFTIDNTGQTISQRSAVAQLDQMFVLLNAQAGDRYLFSGRATNQPPVDQLDRVLNGDVNHAGFRQIVAERKQADLGANGLGRLLFPPSTATAATLAGAGATLTADATASLAGTQDLSGAYTSAAGGTLAINGVNVTINAGDDVTAILAAINAPAVVAQTGVTATAPGGLLTLAAGDDDASIDLTGTSGALLAEFGIATGPADPNTLLTQGAVTASQTLTVTVGANPPLTITFGTNEGALPPEVSTLAELSAALGTLTGGTASVDPTGNITVTAGNTNDAITIGGNANAAAFGLAATGASPSNPVALAEETPATIFGFKLASISSTSAGVVVSGPTGSPAAVAMDFQAQPAENTQVKLAFTLPDGTTEEISLTATTATTPGPGKFAIGSSPTATAANFQAALNAAVSKLADTSLTAASAIAASNNFFDVGAGQPPMRIAGAPPFTAATGLTAGTPANTVTWYTGEMGTDPPRGTAVAQVDNSLTVSYGARANEQALTDSIKNIAVYATMTYSVSDANAQDRFFAVNQRVGTNLAGVNGQQKISDIQAELAFAQSAMTATQQSQAQRGVTLTNLLQGIEQVTPEEAASQILALQTQLQASLQTTSMLFKLSIVNYI
jgi:flagellin-like hook-associated protein FlgL